VQENGEDVSRDAVVVYQQVLRGPHSKNRGIRFRILGPTELDALELKAAKLLLGEPKADPDTKFGRLRQLRLQEGVREMLVAVTKEPVAIPAEPVIPDRLPDGTQPPIPEVPEPSLEDPNLWQAVTIGSLVMPGPYSYDALFSGPDHAHLKGLFTHCHEANPLIVEDVLKKERTVSTG
jgi:hypothetical protein